MTAFFGDGVASLPGTFAAFFWARGRDFLRTKLDSLRDRDAALFLGGGDSFTGLGWGAFFRLGDEAFGCDGDKVRFLAGDAALSVCCVLPDLSLADFRELRDIGSKLRDLCFFEEAGEGAAFTCELDFEMGISRGFLFLGDAST